MNALVCGVLVLTLVVVAAVVLAIADERISVAVELSATGLGRLANETPVAARMLEELKHEAREAAEEIEPALPSLAEAGNSSLRPESLRLEVLEEGAPAALEAAAVEAPGRSDPATPEAGKTVAGNRHRLLFGFLRITTDGLGHRQRGRFGGTLSGDFGREGEQIGEAMFGIFGSAVGKTLGQSVKKGAQEGLGTLRQVGDDMATEISRDEGGLGQVVSEVGTGVSGVVDSLEGALGGEIRIGAGGLGIKIRDDLICVFANGKTGIFTHVDAAVEFAVVEGLRSAQISGASSEVEAALRSHRVRTLDELDEALAQAIRIERVRE